MNWQHLQSGKKAPLCTAGRIVCNTGSRLHLPPLRSRHSDIQTLRHSWGDASHVFDNLDIDVMSRIVLTPRSVFTSEQLYLPSRCLAHLPDAWLYFVEILLFFFVFFSLQAACSSVWRFFFLSSVYWTFIIFLFVFLFLLFTIYSDELRTSYYIKPTWM